MKTTPEIVVIINKSREKHRKQIDEIIERLSILKGKKEITEDMKVALIKYATELSEHKSVIHTLDDILLQIGS